MPVVLRSVDAAVDSYPPSSASAATFTSLVASLIYFVSRDRSYPQGKPIKVILYFDPIPRSGSHLRHALSSGIRLGTTVADRATYCFAANSPVYLACTATVDGNCHSVGANGKDRCGLVNC